MWFMVVLSWMGIIFQLFFIVLAVASGLYYLAELVEEYTTTAGKVIKYIIFFTTCIYLMLLIFEDLPYSMVICGLVSQVVHFSLLSNFPYFEFTSPSFLVGCVLLVVNHYLAFSHFAAKFYPFTQVLGFFTLCLWIVPFAFFISLSANDNVLPTLSESRQFGEDGDLVSHYFSRKGKRAGLLAFLTYAKDTILPERIKKSF
ncbi:Uncharacterized protein HDE_05572 [Halotydeus destructor]|nr:Uncharacterized protein HDE_05572 [Halotydeus destructor]